MIFNPANSPNQNILAMAEMLLVSRFGSGKPPQSEEATHDAVNHALYAAKFFVGQAFRFSEEHAKRELAEREAAGR